MQYPRSTFLSLCFLILFSTIQADEIKANEYEILSLSAAIIDHLVFIDDAALNKIATEKGSWQPIDYETLQTYLNSIGETRMSPGGSGINVLKGLSHLGHDCAVVGKVGSDDMGNYFIRELQNKGIVSFFERGELPTGQAICFITPDGQRTFRSYLGASHSLSDLKLDPSLFTNIKLFHIEGYQLVDPELVLKALKIAKMQGIKTSIDLANTEIVRRYKTFINEILNEYVDILLCNQDEAKELTGLPPKEACALLAKTCPICVVTMSENGCWTQSGEKQFFTPAFAVKPIDTTGAGDYFASGFLHGILTGVPLPTCALQGALVASHVVTQVGTEIGPESWKAIHLNLQPRCFANAQ
jgi:sugar/nucleoside kinase (ribokinase family)